MLYILIYIVLALFSLAEINRKITFTQQRKFIILFCLLFLFLGAIRWETGTDWVPYYDYFLISIKNPSASSFEWGYIASNQFIRFFTDNYTVFLTLIALIIFVFQYLCFKDIIQKSKTVIKEKNLIATKRPIFYPICSLFVIWSLYFGNVFFVRSTIAYLICFFALVKFGANKKHLRFILLVIVASLFHRTALFFLPASYIYHRRFSRKKMIVLFFAGIILGFLFLRYIAIHIISLISNPFFDRLALYLQNANSQDYSLGYSIVFMILKGSINALLIIVILFYFYKDIKKNKIILGLFNVYLFGSILYFISLFTDIALARLATPFLMTQIILIPYIFISRKYKNFSKGIMAVFFIVYLGLRFYLNITAYTSEFFPYKMFFI